MSEKTGRGSILVVEDEPRLRQTLARSLAGREFQVVEATTAQYQHEDHIEELIAAACRLAGSDSGVRSVRVLIPGRPSNEALSCYQEWAHDHHVRLSIDGTGVITVRPDAIAEH